VRTVQRWTWLVAALLGARLVSAEAVFGARGAARQATGTIVGHVRLAGTAPANPVIRMGVDPACSRAYGDTRPTHDFVVRAADGGLANVFVEVRGPFPGAPAPAAPVVLDQRGCMFRPRVIAVRTGQVLEVQNGDPTMHNVHALSTKGNTFSVSQVAGRPPFRAAMAHEEKMLRIVCDVHSWMNVYVAVVDHPYFAITGSDGGFVIRGVPAGRQVVQVWHERYGPLTASAAVAPGGSTTVEFNYVGTERAAPPAGAP
jgi:plastocyanin